MEEQFKYGSIGAENDQGLPFWILVVLPKMFPEYLPRPGGWASLGLSWEQGRELPMGFSKKTIGFDRVAINCALCHTGRVRKPGEAVPRIYPAGPATGSIRSPTSVSCSRAASDPRFTGDNMLTEIAQITRPVAARPDAVPVRARAADPAGAAPAEGRRLRLDQQARRLGARPHRSLQPDQVRHSPREAYGDKPIEEIDDHTIGNSDMQPIWNLRPRVERKMALHWDGLNTDLREVVLSSALGDGASREVAAD